MQALPAASLVNERPTRARGTLLLFIFALAVVTYLDRVCISSAAPSIRDDLHLSPIQMGWVFSAFTFAYAAFEVPSGWLGDVLGPRKVVTRIVLWWSGFTAATAFAWNFPSLVITRFLFGAGEAGAFPNASKSISRWFPLSERGKAHGVLFMGTRLGGALAPPVIVFLIGLMGWRGAFVVFGALGLVWAFFWWRWYRDDPATHSAVNPAEVQLIQAEDDNQAAPQFQWRHALRSKNLLFICLMYFCMGYGLYFYMTWLPTYLKDAGGFSLRSASLLTSLTWLGCAVADMTGGIWTDRLAKKFGLKIGRCVLGAVALGVSGLLLAGAALTANALAAALLVALAAGVADVQISACWAVCLDIGRENAGIVTGCMNTFANLGGALSPLVIGYAIQWWGNWQIPFFIAAFVYLLGGVFWLLIDPQKPLMQNRQKYSGSL